MEKIRIGVLTVSDNWAENETVKESGLNLIQMIENGIVQNGMLSKIEVLPCRSEDVERKLSEWSKDGLDVILTTGGATATETDVTPLRVLIRGLSGVQEKCLILNLPGRKEASQEILEAVAAVIPPAIDQITGRSKKVHESFPWKKSSVTVEDRSTGIVNPLVSVEEAQTLERLYMFRKETMLSYEKAHGHVLAEDLATPCDFPPFDVSLVDGYAVLSTDTLFERTVAVTCNAEESSKVLPGNCLRVGKGAAVPPYADAVVQVEDTEKLVDIGRNKEKKIKLMKLPKKGENIRPRGSEYKKGQLLLSSGTYFNSTAMGVIATAGVTSVKVFQKPKVAIFSIGNDLKQGKVRDSNLIALISLLKEEDVQAEDLGIVPDEPDALLNALERAFRVADVVVTTGSMSVEEEDILQDYLKKVLVSDFNAEICFGRVIMKPLEETSFAILVFEGKPKLCFSMWGNWDSVFVSSQLFLLPALRKISGNEKAFPVSVWVELDELPKLDLYPQYLKVHLKYDNSSSSWTPTLPVNETDVCANGFIQLPALRKVHEIKMRNMADNSTSYYNDGIRFSGNTPKTLHRSNWKFIVKAFLTGKILCAEMY